MAKVNGMMSGERLREHWQSRGIAVRPGVSLDELLVFEHRYGVHLPQDLQEYYLVVDGTDDWDWDYRFMKFLPLAEIKTIREAMPPWPRLGPKTSWKGHMKRFDTEDKFFIIVNFMLGSSVFAIRLDAEADVYTPVWHYPDSREVARSFEEFVDKYLATSDYDEI